MILVVGATGTIGGEVVRRLSARGVPVRALVRGPEKAAAIAGPGVVPVIGDLARPRTLDAALEGVTRALLLSPLDPEQARLQGNFVDAAMLAGTVHVVKLSGLGTAPDSPVPSGRLHAETERRLEASGLPFTHLRPLYFMQNLLALAHEVAETGTLLAPMRAGRIAMIDARDVALAAVATLTTPGHAGRAYTLTGPAALSFEEVAAALTTATGRPVVYRDQPPDDRRARLAATGMSPWLVALRMEFWRVLSAGDASTVTDAVRALTGTAPRGFPEFAADHASLFLAPPSGGATGGRADRP
jgi:uncharacterized protein YbjT (DUF2867 family)